MASASDGSAVAGGAVKRSPGAPAGRALCLGVIGLSLVALAAPAGAAADTSNGASASVRPANGAAGFTTRSGTFTPQAWSAVTGWERDDHAEALVVFRRTCPSLEKRATWRAACAAVRAVRDEPAAARAFFEREFVPYLVSAADRDKDGLLTGYFEPVLQGSPVSRGAFTVPVYGAPPDLLYLDARRWQGIDLRRAPHRAVLDANQVVPAGMAAGASASAAQSSDVVAVDAAVFDSEPLDRRYRVRRDGDRIVPYWTRQEIEAGRAPGLRPIAWVDDAQALYLMQVQGSGRIRMPDGRTLRLAYADQNGHPFRPRGTAPSRTRSLPGAAADEPVAIATPVSLRTLEVAGATRTRAKPVATGQEVDRVVDALLAQPPAAKAGRAAADGRRASAGSGGDLGSASSGGGKAGAGGDGDARAAMNLGYLVAARENDPSYVFFQTASGDGSGPVGALGVPLTATRSIAVDPRSTPLGSPVFIEAERDDSPEPLRRLVIAQDTGGAIRGAVRADFFWGTGPRAGAQALKTRDDLAMWVLLPRDFSPPASATRTRGIGGPAPAECVMRDAEYCLE